MIFVVLDMLRARRGQAVTLALLALFAVAATVAVPSYLHAIDRAVVAAEVAAASPDERGVTVTATVDERDSGPGGITFTDVGGALVALPGFREIYAGEFPALGIDADPKDGVRVTYRQDACAHLTILTGRCMVGAGEVLIGEQTARRVHLGAGDPIALTYVTISGNPSEPVYQPAGSPNPVTVVGLYRVPTPGDPYWGSHGYFAVDSTGRAAEPVFTDMATMSSVDRGLTSVSIDATAQPGTLGPANLAAVGREVAALRERTAQLGAAVTVQTALPDLLDRIGHSRALAAETVPVAAVPLVLLAYVVLYLAAGYSAEGRRPELAVVALHGARWWTRWWFATGESLVAILFGALAGCLAGQLLVDLVVLVRFGTAEVSWSDPAALRSAPLAAAGALVAALLGQRRHLVTPVVELMHQVRSRVGRLPLIAVEAVVAVLAVLTTVQLWLSGGALDGVGLAAPALLMLTVAALVARAVPPVAHALGRRSLRRGRLPGTLAARQLARRPGAQRLTLLLVAAVGVGGYTVCAVDVTARDRAVTARVGTGAHRVVSVAPLTREQLLRAVRTADPDGRWGMAVAQLPAGAPGEAPKLAVDSPRLASVVDWRGQYGPPSAARVAAALRPPAPAPVVVPGQDVALDVTVTGASAATPVGLAVVLSSVAGHGSVTVPFGVLADGPYGYQLRAPACVGGCRLIGIHLTADRIGATNLTLGITIRQLRSLNPSRVAADPGTLRDLSHWRAQGGTLAAAPDGLRLTIDATDGLPGGAWIKPADAPLPLPVVSTARLPAGSTLAGLDGRPIPVTEAARLSALPRLGTDGTLVDLEYADRLSTDAGPARQPEVWLTAAAPADALNRLARQGLLVTGDVDLGQVRDRLDRQGPALAIWFLPLAGALALLLAVGGIGLIGAVDGRGRTGDLTALRVQGLPGRTARRAIRRTYPALVLVAGGWGLVAALVAWRLTGWALPVAGVAEPALPLPRWPDPGILLVSGLAMLAVLVVAALITDRATSKGR